LPGPVSSRPEPSLPCSARYFHYLRCCQGAGVTIPLSINPSGTILGSTLGVAHSFVRARDDAITKFDVPGAGTGSGQGTYGQNINAPGDVDGMYIDGSGAAHGFRRFNQGSITTFDVPGAGNASGQGTFPGQKNPADAITRILHRRERCSARLSVDSVIPANCPSPGKFGRTACEQPGRLGLGHDFTQCGAACLASCRVEGTRHLGGLDRLGDCQSEYPNDRGIAYLAHEFRAERRQHLR
jgi:hypothetical protein